MGKTLGPVCQLGPYLITADQTKPDKLKIRCWVNAQMRQSSNTDELILSRAQISSVMFPGQVPESWRYHFHLHPGGRDSGLVAGQAGGAEGWLQERRQRGETGRVGVWTCMMLIRESRTEQGPQLYRKEIASIPHCYLTI